MSSERSTDPGSPVPGGNRVDTITILLEEYRQMYALALYRLNALDQRVPIACAAITTVLGCVVLLPPTLQVGLLIGLPISLLWLFRTTVNHARSFEDVLRRIEAIEREVNTRSDQMLMSFQSTHPSRGRWVGGRTGRESVHAVLVVSTLLLCGCAALMIQEVGSQRAWMLGYSVLIASVGTALLGSYGQLRRYRYPSVPPSRDRIV